LTYCRFGVIFVVFAVGWRLNISPGNWEAFPLTSDSCHR
jgi:hypothetical protein